jgi:hypothetical protein
MLYNHKSMTKFNIACMVMMRFSFLYDRKIYGFFYHHGLFESFPSKFWLNFKQSNYFQCNIWWKGLSKNYTQVEVFHNKENDEIQNHIPRKALRWMSNYYNHKEATSQKQGLSIMCWEEGLGLQSFRYSNLH